MLGIRVRSNRRTLDQMGVDEVCSKRRQNDRTPNASELLSALSPAQVLLSARFQKDRGKGVQRVYRELQSGL